MSDNTLNTMESNQLKMRCTIFENDTIWLRWASTEGSVDKFDIIKAFIKKSIGHYHRNFTIRFWKWQLYVSTNPFQNLSIVSFGKRYITYRFTQFIYRKSIKKSH